MLLDALLSVSDGTSADAVSGLLRVLFPDAVTLLDVTYGSGSFWRNGVPSSAVLTTLDLDPKRVPDVVGDFRALPFADDTFDVVIFDPPYHTDMSKAKASVMGARFGTFETIDDLKAAVLAGCAEARRVASLGVIVKCQDYIHASRPVWMSQWVRDALGEPYDFMMVRQKHKMLDPKWTRQLSVWRNHATFWVFRFDGQEHKPRKAAEEGVA